jgi:hypothetical protein
MIWFDSIATIPSGPYLCGGDGALKASLLELGIALFGIPGQDADDADVYGDADDQNHEARDDAGARDSAFGILDLTTHRTDVVVACICL